jgi:hypothetical protein
MRFYQSDRAIAGADLALSAILSIVNSVIGVTVRGRIRVYTKCTMQGMEAPMTNTIHSRVAIQARIAEWQRHYRGSDYGPSVSIFGSPQSPADRVRWFRAA